jgi:uncharacterized membrane protein
VNDDLRGTGHVATPRGGAGDEHAAPGAAVGRKRSVAIDALRGLAMVVMVLDHARDFFFGAMRIRPTDLTETTPLLFFTRWVTHFCAPVFVFLAGTSAFLYGARHTKSELSRFLLSRGIFLVLLEITVIRMCWIPDPFYKFTLLQVIWAIGWSMVLLAAAVRLPVSAVVAIGAIVVLGHDAFDGVHAKALGAWGPLWSVLHERASFQPLPGRRVFLSYPMLPWFGLMSLGYGFGSVMRREAAERRTVTLRLGLGATLAFVALRAVNVYGDPSPWAPQRSGLFTLMSFLNCEKYPPSLLYSLMTLGPALCLLAWLDSERVAASAAARRAIAPLAVLGGVPLFFYVAHLVLLRYSSAPIAFVRFGPSAFQPPPGHAGSPELPLGVVYVVWVVAVLALYPLAKRFRAKKEARPESWLRYL